MTGQELKDAIGKNVRNRRLECQKTQRVLAAEVGVTQAQIQFIETGKSAPSIDLLARLASALRTEPQAFLTPEIFSETPA